MSDVCNDEFLQPTQAELDGIWLRLKHWMSHTDSGEQPDQFAWLDQASNAIWALRSHTGNLWMTDGMLEIEEGILIHPEELSRIREQWDQPCLTPAELVEQWREYDWQERVYFQEEGISWRIFVEVLVRPFNLRSTYIAGRRLGELIGVKWARCLQTWYLGYLTKRLCDD